MKLNMNQHFENKFQFRLESARRLIHLEKNHPCSQMHGHSFLVSLIFHGPLDIQKGWLIDFNEIETSLAPIKKKLDHKVLNEIPGLENPTSELLCAWIYWKLKKQTQHPNVAQHLVQVRVAETPYTECAFPVATATALKG